MAGTVAAITLGLLLLGVDALMIVGLTSLALEYFRGRELSQRNVWLLSALVWPVLLGCLALGGTEWPYVARAATIAFCLLHLPILLLFVAIWTFLGYGILATLWRCLGGEEAEERRLREEAEAFQDHDTAPPA